MDLIICVDEIHKVLDKMNNSDYQNGACDRPHGPKQCSLYVAFLSFCFCTWFA